MAETPGDYLADLTTAPIFDNGVYLSEALRLPEGQDEDDLDAQLAMAARESGIEDPYRFLSPDVNDVSAAVSTMTVSSAPRSSMSISTHSRETQSTGFTSHNSACRMSRDNSYTDISPIFRAPPPMRASLSMDNYDAMMDRGRPWMRNRHSTSTLSGATIFSATSSPNPTPRKLKRASGLGLFSIFRKESSSCPSRSRHGHHTKPLSRKLECGHTLSNYAIRVHVQDALESDKQTIPNCCGKPLPKSVLESVLTKDEADIISSNDLFSPSSNSLRDSDYGDDGLSIDLPHLETQSLPNGSFFASPTSSPAGLHYDIDESLNQVLSNEAFKSLQMQRKEQYEQIASFESNQRKALEARYQWSLKRLAYRLESRKVERRKQHPLELERLEEFQILAEHEMREAHAQEVQNVATALKYMEAYCSGASLTNPDVLYTVTDEHRKKLAHQHMIQQKLPAKHESAINVLRARQEKNAKAKLQKQQAELQQLDADHERDKRAEEFQYMQDTARLNALIKARRKRVIQRWDLKLEMWRRDWETQHKITLNGRLPHETWPECPKDASLESSSALALYLQVLD